MAKLKLKEGWSNDKDFDYFTMKFEVPIYGWRINVCFSTDIKGARNLKEFTRVMGETDRPDSRAFAFCETHMDKLTGFVFFPMNPKDYRTASVATLAHEALHAATAILDSAGVDYTDNDEALAYLLEYIVNKFDKFSRDIHYFMEEILKDIVD